VEAVYCPTRKLESVKKELSISRDEIVIEGVDDVNAPEFIESQLGSSLFVVAGFSTIFSPGLLNQPTYGTLNLHAGKLPGYRGGSPLNWQIIQGEPELGLSVIRMDERIDCGNVMAQEIFKISLTDTINNAHERADKIFPVLTIEAINRLEAGDSGTAQDEDKACYWHQRSDADGIIDWQNTTAREVSNFVRAITRPYPGAHTSCNGKKLRIYSVSGDVPVIRGMPGRVLYIQKQGPYVICQDKALLLTDFKCEDDTDFNIPHGAHLGSSS
jgi:methionyl-tRNA formyltransferase